jgi:hypothetical protein
VAVALPPRQGWPVKDKALQRFSVLLSDRRDKKIGPEGRLISQSAQVGPPGRLRVAGLLSGRSASQPRGLPARQAAPFGGAPLDHRRGEEKIIVFHYINPPPPEASYFLPPGSQLLPGFGKFGKYSS